MCSGQSTESKQDEESEPPALAGGANPYASPQAEAEPHFGDGSLKPPSRLLCYAIVIGPSCLPVAYHLLESLTVEITGDWGSSSDRISFFFSRLAEPLLVSIVIATISAAFAVAGFGKKARRYAYQQLSADSADTSDN